MIFQGPPTPPPPMPPGLPIDATEFMVLVTLLGAIYGVHKINVYGGQKDERFNKISFDKEKDDFLKIFKSFKKVCSNIFFERYKYNRGKKEGASK